MKYFITALPIISVLSIVGYFDLHPSTNIFIGFMGGLWSMSLALRYGIMR